MLYFDNAATTYPKPDAVKQAVLRSMSIYGANPGRGGYKMAEQTAELVFGTRCKAADFFGLSQPERVIFCQNCTTALNTVIQGLAYKGCRFVISSLEHNAVLRPLETLKKAGICDYDIAKVEERDEDTVSNFEKLICDRTAAIICTGASNVFGKMLPVKMLASLAHRHNILFVLDAAQVAGVSDINMQRDGIDILCVAAHKGLYAPMSAGLLLIGCDKLPEPLTQGGTGSLSQVFTQPDFLPDRFESGTLSVPLIAGVEQGIIFVKSKGVSNIYNHETELIKMIFYGLREMKNIVLYTDFDSDCESFAPILSFNVKGLTSEETAQRLSEKNIAVRGGFHCAFLAHKQYKTDSVGTVRVAPGVFNGKNDVKLLLNSIFQIAKQIII